MRSKSWKILGWILVCVAIVGVVTGILAIVAVTKDMSLVEYIKSWGGNKETTEAVKDTAENVVACLRMR